MNTAAAMVLAGAMAAAGCAAPRETVRIVREPVEVPIAVTAPCVSAQALPAPPKLMADAELARLDDAALVLSIEQQRRLLREYVTRADPLLAACAGRIDLQSVETRK